MPDEAEITTFVMDMSSSSRVLKGLGQVFLVGGVAMFCLTLIMGLVFRVKNFSGDLFIGELVASVVAVILSGALLYLANGHLGQPTITLTDTDVQWIDVNGQFNSCQNGQFVYRKLPGDSFDRYGIETVDGRKLAISRQYSNYDLLLAKLQERAVQSPSPLR